MKGGTEKKDAHLEVREKGKQSKAGRVFFESPRVTTESAVLR